MLNEGSCSDPCKLIRGLVLLFAIDLFVFLGASCLEGHLQSRFDASLQSA